MNFFSNYGFDAGEGGPPARRGLVCSPNFELRTSNSQIRAERGFSMIEIALALAVIGIAMVSILGLLSIGLNAARDSTDDNVAAQIVQAIIADRQSTPFGSSTPPITATSFNIPALSAFPVTYTLFFPKSGGKPDLTSQPGKSYFEVNIQRHSMYSPDFDNLAVLDIRVSWPASAANMNNRMTYFYTTAIGNK